MNSSESRNTLIAFALSVLVLVGWNYFFPNQPNTQSELIETKKVENRVSTRVNHKSENEWLQSHQSVSTKSITIDTLYLKGTINSLGCQFNNIELKKYTNEPENRGNHVQIMNTKTDNYYAEFGWLSENRDIVVPNAHTNWHIDDHQTLTVDHPVTMTWKNDYGLIFVRTIAIDKDYMFTLTDRVTNSGTETYSLALYGLIVRKTPVNLANFFILHEGPIGYLDKKLIEHKYNDFDKTKHYQYAALGGWVGITDKYWLTAIIPDQSTKINANYSEVTKNTSQTYQTDYATNYFNVNALQDLTYVHRLYVGPKKLSLLDNYETQMNIPHFDLAVDFGWFYFLTKPIFYLLTSLGNYVGNFGVAILIFTLMLKLIMFPLANKSYRSMAHMRELQPKIEALKLRCGDDRMKLNQEMIDLYKKEKINPAAGCLPMILQIPVFFALYKVLFVTIEMRHAPFFGWIHDLSAPDPTTLFNLFGLLPFTPPNFLMIGAWPLIMGATMFIQQKLTPAPADPTQAKVMMFLPVIFTFTLAQFPAGLVIYWAWNNILTIIQQTTIMQLEKRHISSNRR